ncbi:MAG: NADH-quinone oxidoreductase subunit L, partial [Chloroflexota bacterium]
MAGILITLVIALPWIGAIVVWLARNKHARLQHTLAVLFSVLTAIASVVLLRFASAETVKFPFLFGKAFGELTFVPDGLAVTLTAIAAVIGSLAVIFSVDYMHGEEQLGRYYFLVLFFIGSMTGLVLSGNLLFTFFFWEITALCSYGLISFYNDDPKAVAGGIKALIITQVGGVGLLAGTLIAFTYVGFQISDLLGKTSAIPAASLSLIAFSFLVAAAAKSAQFPFHTWLPDAMEAPTPISALIHAATMVNAGIYLLARFYPAFEAVPGWTMSVLLVGLISAVISAVAALIATDLKRTLAYSTVSQLGYMVYAIGAGGVFASQFHLLSHAVFKALLFLAAGSVIHSVGTRDMRRMGGLGQQMPFVRNVFIVGALALAGILPLNGFWSKE